MALSFLSGDAGTPSLKEVEARAYAIEAARNINKARKIQKQEDENEDLMFIGLDEIGRRKQKPPKKDRSKPQNQEQIDDDRQPKPQPQPQNSGPSKSSTPSPVRTSSPAPGRPPQPSPTQGAKLAPGGGGRARIVDTLPGGGGPITTAPRDVTKTLVSAEVRDKKLAERELEGLLKKAEDSVEKAEQAAQENDQPSGFLQNKNLLIIGGVAVAAIAGIYFFTRKK
jgi:outer membrane biosynthesis protein TonB